MIYAADNISTKLMESEVSLHFILYMKYLCKVLHIGLIKDLKAKAQ